MIVKGGRRVYPISQRRIQLGSKIIYDRDKRGKSWFILDLAIYSGPAIIPKGSTGLITADGQRLTEHYESRRGKPPV